MKIRLLFVCLILSRILYSQITITSTDMPSVNDVFIYSNTLDIQGNDPKLTGTNYIWDYSALTYTTQSSDTFVAVSSTPVAYQFYFNNSVLYPTWEASYAIKGMDIVIPQFPITDVYNYYSNANSGSDYSHVGFGSNINGVPSSTRNIPVDVEYSFPMNYGDTHQSYSKYELGVPTIGTYGQALERTDTVDGWGTLITPYGTFNCLRVKSILNKTDTTYLDALGFGTNIPRPEEIEYKWLANGEGTPLLKIVTNLGTVTSIQYQDSARVIGVNENEIFSNINFFPNPTSDYLSIDFQSKTSGKMTFSFKDYLGRIVFEEEKIIQIGKNIILFSLSDKNMNSGVYLVETLFKGNFASQKIVYNKR